jgi:hypothetical protein
MFWVYFVIPIVLLLTAMFLWDRSAKRKGHQMRAPGAMARLANDGRRDSHAMAASPMVGTADTTWTAYSRHNAGAGERSHRENDELDDPHLAKDSKHAED